MAEILHPPAALSHENDGNALSIPMIERSESASPPPSLSPSFALSSCPTLDRSVSTASSSASLSSSIGSAESTSSRLSAIEGPLLAVNKRRGYMRPQATNFSNSAKQRESVMSLGSIAHLQYYFARTGLLDGKGAQLARRRQAPDGSFEYDIRRSSSNPNRDTIYIGSPDTLLLGGTMDDAMKASVLVDSPVEQEEEPTWQAESPAMLPPTVSTYNHRPVYVPPPPDVKTLRKELLEAVEDACKVLEELHKTKTPSAPSTPKKDPPANGAADGGPANETPSGNAEEAAKDEEKGMHEIQGLHLLDVTTLAIRAAKNYYTAHERPERLYSIKSERTIRTELYQVLEVLKRMAGRNFAGGIKASEQNAILLWIVGISDLLKTEEDQERAEQEERDKWSWRTGDWTGKERERERLFIKSLMPKEEAELPEWTEPPSEQPPAESASGADGEETAAKADSNGASSQWRSPFLERLRTGVLLVHAHNAAVRASKRQFEEITKWHTDTAKPYRRAENVRYFIKAAERRWDVKLTVDVLGFVSDDKPEDVQKAAWLQFDAALMEWCKNVREEITKDWEAKEREKGQTSPR